MRIDSDTPAGAAPDYVQRVNRAIDFVLQHLDQPLQLDVLASVACFSPCHFHRIFRSLVGETVHEFQKRLRLERAVVLLSRGPDRSLTAVALACGFSSPSDFSRCFKQHYGVAPSAFDVETFRTERRTAWQNAIAAPHERHRLDRLPTGTNPDGFAVRLRELPARCVAYLRVANSFRPGAAKDAAMRLMAWAEAHGRADGQWLGYMWDDPEVTAPEHCRYDVGVVVPHVEPAGEIGRFDFPAMQVAEIEIRGPIDLEMRAIDWFYRTWLPGSGYVPTDQPAFEAWLGRPFAHGDEHFELCMQVPVERA